MELSATITIERPIDEVFSYLTEVTNMPHWVSGVRDASLVSDKMGLGARFVCDYAGTRRSFDIELVATRYEPPHLFGIELSSGPFSFAGLVGLFHLAPEDGGTRITNVIESDPDSLASRLASVVFGRLLKRAFRTRLQRELLALKEAVAGETHSRTA